MNNFRIHALGVVWIFTKIRFFDLVGINDRKEFKASLGVDNHNDFFKEELVHRYSWKFYAVKCFKKRLIGLVLAKLIVRMFLDRLMHDLIYENDYYYFPGGKNVMLKVGVRDNKKSKNYKYNPETYGDDIALLIRFSINSLKRLGHIAYYATPTRRWKKKIEENSKKFNYK